LYILQQYYLLHVNGNKQITKPANTPHPLRLTSIGILGKKGEKGGASSRYLLR